MRLLAAAQRKLGEPLSADPADWYGAVATFSGADDRATAAAYADDVYDVIRTGERRTTDTGERVTLTAPLPDHMARTWKTLGWHENDVPDDPFADNE